MDWSKITVEQFVKTQKIIKEDPLDELDLHAQKKLIAEIITNKSIADIENMKMRDLDATQMTSGRYMSIMESIKQNPLDNIHTVLFNVAHPVKRTLTGFKRYDFEPAELHKRIEDFKQMPISIANPMAVFFCNLSVALTSVSVDYSVSQMEIMNKEMNQLAEDLTDGDG